jgi:hypothetical protein
VRLRSTPLLPVPSSIDPQAWPADVLARLPDHPAKRIHELLPWNWRPQSVAHRFAGVSSQVDAFCPSRRMATRQAVAHSSL